jgi:DNA-directed RNA polymerase III subunit RPC3
MERDLHPCNPLLQLPTHMRRYPRFLLHIKDEMGEEAERILEILLQTGRLSLEQIVKAVAGRLEQDASTVSERVQNIFMSMVQSHYIERVRRFCC